jgi:site-specific DNA-methyltransferase (adenine-specific)
MRIGSLELNQIYRMDCIEGMKLIPDGSVDMILCDLPYGITKNKWDSLIPLDALWLQYLRIIKENGAIILFGQDKFTARLMLSQPKFHRYNLIWDKVLTSGFLNSNKMPLRSHEDIMIFYKKPPTYNPQKVKGSKSHSRGKPKEFANNNYGNFNFVDNADDLGDMKHPKSILTFSKVHASIAVHPTQKPVELCEWLIKTYTNENEIVLDNCIGSGSTALACELNNRKWIGFETDQVYVDIANKRLDEVKLLA